jgi:hypothetical protein
MLDAGFTDLTVTSFAPVADQSAIVEMLTLALSHEMKNAIVDKGFGTADEVDAVVRNLRNMDRGALISVDPAYQVTGIRH